APLRLGLCPDRRDLRPQRGQLPAVRRLARLGTPLQRPVLLTESIELAGEFNGPSLGRLGPHPRLLARPGQPLGLLAARRLDRFQASCHLLPLLSEGVEPRQRVVALLASGLGLLAQRDLLLSGLLSFLGEAVLQT